jgi:hypothetical protein
MVNITQERKQTRRAIIESLTVKHIIDDCGDSSFYGEYTDKWEPGAINRKYRGWERNQYRYFIPCTSYKEHWKGLHKMGYSRGDCDYLSRKYVLQDYNRMERLNRGDWGFIGIVAEAEVKYPIGGGNYRIERLTSGGLWGIESDGGMIIFKRLNPSNYRI